MVTLGTRIGQRESCHKHIKWCETALSGVNIYISNSLEIMSYLPKLLQGILMTKEFKKVLIQSIYVYINCRNYVGSFFFFPHFITLFRKLLCGHLFCNTPGSICQKISLLIR